MADEVPEQIPAGQPEKSDGEDKSSDKEPAPMKKGPKVKASAKAKAKADAKSKAKASAKNKAVVSAKAKAKAKAKAAPKATICKRPSMAAPKTPMKKKTEKSEPSAPVKPSKSNKDEEKPDQKNKDKGMKRPSSKNEPEKRNLFGGLPDDKPDPENEDQKMEEGEEEEEFEDDMEIEEKAEDIKEDKKTDRSKKQKFLAMLAGNQLPDFVKKQWEGTKAMKTGRTEAQRSIINAAFDRSTAGKLILSLEKPVFQSARAQYQDKSSSSIEKSLPKTLFCGKFNLSPESQVTQVMQLVSSNSSNFCSNTFIHTSCLQERSPPGVPWCQVQTLSHVELQGAPRGRRSYCGRVWCCHEACWCQGWADQWRIGRS